MGSTVVQGWVSDLPLKMQSVLLTSTRGPDEFRHPHIKMANRWLRSVLFHDADPANPFIVKNGDKNLDEILDELAHELEYVSVHYFGHFIHAFEIIAARHPDQGVANIAAFTYIGLCAEILHLPPEPVADLERRLADITEHD